jgi:hypothetical protein
MESKGSARRYFVSIHAPSLEALSQLGGRGLDLFRASAVRAAVDLRAARARALDAGTEPEAVPPPGIQGLLDINQVQELVHGGYRVTLESDASMRPRPAVVEFEDWLAGLEG